MRYYAIQSKKTEEVLYLTKANTALDAAGVFHSYIYDRCTDSMKNLLAPVETVLSNFDVTEIDEQDYEMLSDLGGQEDNAIQIMATYK